ncbi:hypothetical protein H9P43_005355 [Blastocladiella emersonii ATCC 22665]|nr:hypothetical protein H9P43_005355 [Blastocladiella emersonii ATCC 22665]
MQLGRNPMMMLLSRTLLRASSAATTAAVRTLATAATSTAAPAAAAPAAAATETAAPAPETPNTDAAAAAVAQAAKSIPATPAKPATFESAVKDLHAALRSFPAEYPDRSLLPRLVLAGRHASLPADRLIEVEHALREWRSRGLPVSQEVTKQAVRLAAAASPFRAVGWLGDPVTLGLSPSRADLEHVLESLLSASRAGTKHGRVRGEPKRAYQAGLGVLGMFDAYALGGPSKLAYAAAVELCRADGTPAGDAAALALLGLSGDGVATGYGRKTSVATELQRMRYHQGAFRCATPADQVGAARALACFERAVKLESPATGAAPSPRKAFAPALIRESIAAINALRLALMSSKDAAVRDRSKKAFETSWKNRGIAYHAEMLTKYVASKAGVSTSAAPALAQAKAGAEAAAAKAKKAASAAAKKAAVPKKK